MNLARLEMISALNDMTNLSITELAQGADRIHHFVLINGMRISISIFKP